MNERLSILKLLEQRKINAEEAARLLEALNEGETKKKGPFGFWHSMEVIPEMVSSAIAGSFKHATTKENLQFPKKNKIDFKGISGDIEVIGEDTELISIQKDGFAKIKEEEHTLEIKAISGDVKIKTPKNIDLEIKGVSGNLDIYNLNGKIEIASVSGDITGKELSGSLKGEFVCGDVDLSYKEVDKINIKTKTGDITLRLDKNAAAEVEVETKDGDIDCEFELKNKEEKTNYLRGIINKPSGKIEIKNDYGDVAIKKKT